VGIERGGKSASASGKKCAAPAWHFCGISGFSLGVAMVAAPDWADFADLEAK